MSTRTLNFSKSIPLSDEGSEEHLCLVSGAITQVVMAFPSGTSYLVDVRVVYLPKDKSREFVVPSVEDQFIALVDSTPHYAVDHPVRKDGVIRVEWVNHDAASAHRIPVQVTIKERAAPSP